QKRRRGSEEAGFHAAECAEVRVCRTRQQVCMTYSDEEQLEERLGYRFRDRRLLVTALTHSSATPELRLAFEAGGGSPAEILDNERLEFLGDAVLDLLASEYLVATFPDWSEGQLSR